LARREERCIRLGLNELLIILVPVVVLLAIVWFVYQLAVRRRS
jgi:hypothetical protein